MNKMSKVLHVVKVMGYGKVLEPSWADLEEKIEISICSKEEKKSDTHDSVT